MEQWSVEHVAALVVTGVAVMLLIAGARRWGDAWTVAAGRGLAVIILGGFVCEQVTYALRHEWRVQVNLPLQLSDAVVLASGVASGVPTRRSWSRSSTSGRCASVQAVLTPDLMQSFPDPLFFAYFATHSGAIAAACLLVFGARRTPRPGALWRVYAMTATVAAVAAAATVATGGNYMFLRRRPVGGSLLDLMGPWPVYIVVGAAFGLTMFIALAALARWTARRAHSNDPPRGHTPKLALGLACPCIGRGGATVELMGDLAVGSSTLPHSERCTRAMR
jgi:hypothetical integral membrane protein (TIGR02206 family)